MSVVRLFFDHLTGPRGTVQRIALEGAGARRLMGKPIYSRFRGVRLQPPEVLDGPLISALMIPMRLRGADELHVPGPISAEALKNLVAWQEAWSHMAPDWFHPVRIVPERIVTTPRSPMPAAISAFSGGLDGMFSAIRHVERDVSEGGYDLGHVLMVHGFDVRPEDQALFDDLVRRVRPVLDQLGLTPILVRTNTMFTNPSRPQLMAQPFFFSQAAQLTGLFHVLAGRFGHGLIASSEPYSKLVMPWASNPATDYLLSSDRMRIVHDGAGFTRTEKARFMLDHPEPLRALKVCPESVPGNCGECEKCVRTRLNFLAAGARDPPCFDTPFRDELIDNLDAWNPTIANEARSTIAYAERAGISSSWLDRLKRRSVVLDASHKAAGWHIRFTKPRARKSSARPSIRANPGRASPP